MKKINLYLCALLIPVLSFGQQISFDDVVVESDNELIFIKLRASTNSNSYSTDIYFNDNASLGFDLGFDASLFGTIPAFVLFTELVEENTGLPLALQAVNTNDLAGVSIPLGVNSNLGEELTISITTSTLPPSIEVYLDDTLENTSTLLNDSDFVLTPATNVSGTGRFFLRTLGPSITFTYDGTWSPSNPNGTATVNDDIIIESGVATISSNTTCNSVMVNPGAGLEVTTGVTITSTNGMTLESSSTSYSSLILDGTVAGAISYQRHVNINGSGTTGSNDLISAPLTGQQFNEVATENTNILNNGALYLFGPFEKSSGSFVTWAGTETATLDAGVGYRAATSDNSTITFRGTAENDVVSVDIVNGGTNNEEWNLVGNPYPSYINFQEFFLDDAAGAPGVTNVQLLDPPTAAVYGYDGSALNGWTVYNMATTLPSTLMAPGQGFFVSANAINTTSNDLRFDPSIRRSGTTDDFIVGRNAQLTYLKLNASTANDSFGTDIYFNANASLGFDLGYDAGLWGETTPDFALYSHLVQDNSGRAMALQTIDIANLSEVVIPLGVNANQGEQLTFTIAEMTLPSSINVYLDDVVASSSTLLNYGDYVVTPTTSLSGTGRFFLRTSEDALSTSDNSLDILNIFALNSSKELVINGQLLENTNLELYDIQGRKVLSSQLNSDNLENRIDVSALNGGVYIVTVKNNGQLKTQKVIFD